MPNRALRGVVLLVAGAAAVAGLLLLPRARQVASGAIGERVWWSLSGSSVDAPGATVDRPGGSPGAELEVAARLAPDLWEVQWLIASFRGPLGAWVEVEEVWKRRSRLTPIDLDRPRLSAAERRAIAGRVLEAQARQVRSASGGQAELVRIAIEDARGRVVRVSWPGWARIAAASAIVGAVVTVLVAGVIGRRAQRDEREDAEERGFTTEARRHGDGQRSTGLAEHQSTRTADLKQFFRGGVVRGTPGALVPCSAACASLAVSPHRKCRV